MFVGKVVGTVWSSVKWPALSGHKLLLVRPYHLEDLKALQAGAAPHDATPPPSANQEAVVCVDLLDAGVGEDVVVAFGHAARVAAERSGRGPTTTPIDAAIVAIVAGMQLSPAA
jgi:ethanolamine utilization protein EutN